MDKKGQVLVLFIIVLPLILLLIALVVDIGIITNEKLKLENVSKQAIRYYYDNEDVKENNIIELIKKNEINIDNLEVNIIEEQITIKSNYEINSIFGNIVGIKKYTIKINLKGIKENNKVKFIKE